MDDYKYVNIPTELLERVVKQYMENHKTALVTNAAVLRYVCSLYLNGETEADRLKTE